MRNEAEHPTDALSALVDGELDTEAIHHACLRWREDVHARVSWHAYHLIGDVLRSDALASAAEHDEGFLRRLRERLAAEPAVLAPQPLASPESAAPARRAPTRWAWLAPAAVAAGFMALASVLVLTQINPAAPGSEGATLAKAAPERRSIIATAAPARAGSQIAVADSIVEPQTLVADGKLVRDARLDRYLAAHMEFGGSSALGAPSGFLRAATTRTPDR